MINPKKLTCLLTSLCLTMTSFTIDSRASNIRQPDLVFINKDFATLLQDYLKEFDDKNPIPKATTTNIESLLIAPGMDSDAENMQQRSLIANKAMAQSVKLKAIKLLDAINRAEGLNGLVSVSQTLMHEYYNAGDRIQRVRAFDYLFSITSETYFGADFLRDRNNEKEYSHHFFRASEWMLWGSLLVGGASLLTKRRISDKFKSLKERFTLKRSKPTTTKADSSVDPEANAILSKYTVNTPNTTTTSIDNTATTSVSSTKWLSNLSNNIISKASGNKYTKSILVGTMAIGGMAGGSAIIALITKKMADSGSSIFAYPETTPQDHLTSEYYPLGILDLYCRAEVKRKDLESLIGHGSNNPVQPSLLNRQTTELLGLAILWKTYYASSPFYNAKAELPSDVKLEPLSGAIIHKGETLFTCPNYIGKSQLEWSGINLAEIQKSLRDSLALISKVGEETTLSNLWREMAQFKNVVNEVMIENKNAIKTQREKINKERGLTEFDRISSQFSPSAQSSINNPIYEVFQNLPFSLSNDGTINSLQPQSSGTDSSAIDKNQLITLAMDAMVDEYNSNVLFDREYNTLLHSIESVKIVEKIIQLEVRTQNRLILFLLDKYYKDPTWRDACTLIFYHYGKFVQSYYKEQKMPSNYLDKISAIGFLSTMLMGENIWSSYQFQTYTAEQRESGIRAARTQIEDRAKKSRVLNESWMRTDWMGKVFEVAGRPSFENKNRSGSENFLRNKWILDQSLSEQEKLRYDQFINSDFPLILQSNLVDPMRVLPLITVAESFRFRCNWLEADRQFNIGFEYSKNIMEDIEDINERKIRAFHFHEITFLNWLHLKLNYFEHVIDVRNKLAVYGPYIVSYHPKAAVSDSGFHCETGESTDGLLEDPFYAFTESNIELGTWFEVFSRDRATFSKAESDSEVEPGPMDIPQEH